MTATRKTLDVVELGGKSKEELLSLAPSVGLGDPAALDKMHREDILGRMFQVASANQSLISTGILEIMDEGYGFLRQVSSYRHSGDVYISQSQIRRFGLRTGDTITGQVRPPKEGERYFGLVRVEKVNGFDASRPFRQDPWPQPSHLRAPDARSSPRGRWCWKPRPTSFPPAWWTSSLPSGWDSAASSSRRPRPARPPCSSRSPTAWLPTAPRPSLWSPSSASAPRKSPICAAPWTATSSPPPSTRTSRSSAASAELCLDRAKRLVELGKDVVILLDSITRLTRAYNLAVPTSGRTLSGGIDPIALYPPKKFFGGARNIEEGGSLTIIATCLVDTGSRMDEVIYEEFKGTGNMELHLDRKLAERRYFPAIDIVRSGTRREELLYSEEAHKQVVLLRRMIGMLSNNSNDGGSATERVLERLAKTPTNHDFLRTLSAASA